MKLTIEIILEHPVCNYKNSVVKFQMVSPMLDFATSLKPDLHRALLATIRHYEWKNIIYLYCSQEGKVKVKNLVFSLKCFVSSICFILLPFFFPCSLSPWREL